MNSVEEKIKNKRILKEELKNKLTDFVHLWATELFIEKNHYNNYNDSTRLFMDSIGKQMESIALTTCNYYFGENINDYEACGSEGFKYDLINTLTDKGVEVKSCNLMQNVICSCGKRYNPIIYSRCPVCGNTSRIERKDTRFIIDAKEIIRQIEKGLFDRFIFVTVDSTEVNTSESKVTISIAVDSVKFSDNPDDWGYALYKVEGYTTKTGRVVDPRLEYFYNQVEFGSKVRCNLLPNSYDYFKLLPERLFDITISFCYDMFDDYNKDKIKIDIKEPNRHPSVPLEILRKKERDFVEENFVSYNGGNNTVGCIEFSAKMPFRNKSLGKDRGDTTKQKDASLVQRLQG